MKILYLDCFSGISGDMAVGALVDAGVPLAFLRDGIARLGFDESIVRLETRSLVRSQIHATKLDVIDVEARERWRARAAAEGKHAGASDHDHEDGGATNQDLDHVHGDEISHAQTQAHPHTHEHGHEHAHTHEHDDVHAHESGREADHEHAHTHEHEDVQSSESGREQDHEHAHAHANGNRHESAHAHGRVHSHAHEDGHAHSHGHGHTHEHVHRSYADIRQLIEASDLPERVRGRSLAIFRAIGIAEARVHDVKLEDIHFHEVGAVDSIADIVAFALCLEYLGIDEVYASKVPLGSGGFIETQHGTMPLPAPATLEILKGFPVQLSGVPFELTTPTGAGIIKALAKGQLALETLSIERIGFGAGTRELPDRPNLLRAIVGERIGSNEHDVVTLVECSIDDLNPQIYPHLFERLLGAGANDVYLTPVLMKKGRPGHVLTVTAEAGVLEEVTRIIFAETTTIGVRYSERSRRKLVREDVVIATEFGSVRMKRVALEGGTRTSPELEEARRIAVARSLPLQVVMRRLQEVAAACDSTEEAEG